MPRTTVHRFGSCELDEARRQLRRSGEVVRIGPQIFDLLLELVRQSHRVVRHDELRSTVWRDRAISEAAMHASVSRARAAVGDRHGSTPMIRTFPRYGYRFVAAVTTEVRAAGRRIDAHTAERGYDESSVEAPAVAGYVGRASELTAIAAALDDAIAGHGALMLITGEPGAGKTRLAAEIARLGVARAMDVLIGRGDDTDHPPPFWPWAQILRGYALQHEPDEIRASLGSAGSDVARIAPALRDRCPDIAAAPPPDALNAELRVHEGLLGFVRQAAAARPLLFLIDDLQWCDAASRRVVGALAHEVAGMRALLVVLGDVSAADVGSGRAIRHLPLDGLDLEGVRRLVDDALGQASPVEFAQALTDATDGNPMVVLDTLHHLADIEVLSAGRGVWPDRDAIASAGLSAGTCAAVNRRLRRLGADCVRALGVAAVCGAEFAFDDLARVAGQPVDAIVAAIEEAAGADVVRPLDADGRRYRFTRRHVRDAIEQTLNPTRRARVRALLGA